MSKTEENLRAAGYIEAADDLKAYEDACEHFGVSAPYVKIRLGWVEGLPDNIQDYSAGKVIELVMVALHKEIKERSDA